MKCTNKVLSLILITGIFASILSGCGKQYAIPYERSMNSSAFMLSDLNGEQGYLDAFAENLCMDDQSKYLRGITIENSHAYGLFDLNDQEVLQGDNIYEELPPASITKIMTALVALKYGNLDDQLTVSPNCKITESGAQKSSLKEGDHITLDQALNILLIYSANDVALMIAEHVGGGDINHFVDMMNNEAKKLGATHTNFKNPHGLNEDDHYTTVYDLYLIFNEVIKYDRFREIIQQSSYSTTYTDALGTINNISIESTNQYIKGNCNAPEGVTVLGGKTGTTNAAGSCLIIYSKDKSGNPYISVILHADTRDNLYNDMNSLLEGELR